MFRRHASACRTLARLVVVHALSSARVFSTFRRVVARLRHVLAHLESSRRPHDTYDVLLFRCCFSCFQKRRN